MPQQPFRWRRCIFSIAGFAILLALGWVAWQAIVAITSLDKDVLVALVAAVTTVVASVLTIVMTNRANKVREIAEAHRPQKVGVYSRFMDTMVAMLRESKTANVIEPKDNAKIMETFFTIKRDIMAWASPGVIAAYVKMEVAAPEDTILLHLDTLLREMRKDLGMDDRDLAPGVLLGLFLTKEGRADFADRFKTA